MQQFTIERIGEGKLPARKDNMRCGFKWYFKSSTTDIPLPKEAEITKIEFASPIAISPGDVIPAELTIEIQGQCNKCGYCCGYRNKKLIKGGCSHVIITGSKKGECAIYDHHADFCDEHKESHKDCIPRINMPVKKFNPDCGCSFVIISPELVVKGKEIIFFEVVNFTGHLTEGAQARK